MKYKRSYTEEDVKTLYGWYDSTRPKGEIDMGHGLYVADIETLFDNSRKAVMEKFDNVTYSGQIQLLFRVQEAWQKQKAE